ncbi:LmeA family phospholipid-binding protein [Quadrisphaera sp. KR29]|uniref:LmeA family phospholipid-binding protein n=1 Tax=Quadrisphaera sp. KR29 TaxID=3461391 RepID=UPI0040447351
MLRRLLLTLVVVSVIAGGAVVAAPLVDAAVRTSVQERVAVEVARQTGATGGVDVEVRGGWFVPQALRGRYEDVRVVARGVPAGDLRVEEVDAHLSGVVVPLRELADGRVDRVEVERATSTASLAYPVLNGVLGQRQPPLSVAPDQGALRVTGTARVLGQDVSLSALVDLTAQAGGVSAVPRRLDSGSALLDRLSRSVLSGLRDRLAFQVPLEQLPFSQQVTGVEVRTTGLVVSTAGQSIVVGS